MLAFRFCAAAAAKSNWKITPPTPRNSFAPLQDGRLMHCTAALKHA
jgi:hypothetical protein